MGTRHLIAAVIDGDYKIAQYGQWDGYPDGQGVSIIKFLHELQQEEGVDEFKAKLKGCRFLSKEEHERLWVNAGADMRCEYISMEISDRFKESNPQLSRDAGADVLSMVWSSDAGLPLKDSLSFAGDSLFCEYAYVLDFDSNTLEVYRGFNREPLADGERFKSAPANERSEYLPVRLLHTFTLIPAPSESEFLSAFENKEVEA